MVLTIYIWKVVSLRFLIYLCLLFCGTLYGAANFKKLEAPYRVIFFILLFTFLSETASRICIAKLRSSMPPYHFLQPLELVMYPLAYLLFLEEWVRIKRVLKGLLVIGPLISILVSFKTGLFQFHSMGTILLSLIVIPCSLFGFVQLIKNADDNLPTAPAFWFHLGILVFFTLSYFQFAFSRFLIHSAGLNIPGWSDDLVTYSSFFLYGCLTLALWLNSKRPQYA